MLNRIYVVFNDLFTLTTTHDHKKQPFAYFSAFGRFKLKIECANLFSFLSATLDPNVIAVVKKADDFIVEHLFRTIH